MHILYWSYNGFCGDQFCGDPNKTLAKRYAPNSRSVGFKYFTWLNQKGHGPGYFNNSGVYTAFRKSVFNTEADRDAAIALMKKSFNSCTQTVYVDDVAYYDALAETKLIEKCQRKVHPY